MRNATRSTRELLVCAGGSSASRRSSPPRCPSPAPTGRRRRRRSTPTGRCRRSPTRSSRAARSTRPRPGAPIHPQAIAGVDPRAGAVETDALALYHHPKTGFDALAPAFLADLDVARAAADVPRARLRRRAPRSARPGLAFDNPAAVGVGGRGRGAVHRVLRRGAARGADRGEGRRLPRDGPAGRSDGYRRAQYSYRRKLARERTTNGYLRLMAERVDVLIAGSGFGGSITAFRLAELYRAAGADPTAILVLERGAAPRGLQAVDAHRPPVGRSTSSSRATARRSSSATASAAGRTSTSPRRCARRARRSSGATAGRATAPTGGCGRPRSRAASLDPYYARAEAALRVARPSWKQVSKSGGLWAATLAHAGHTCDRVPLAIDQQTCRNVKWCHTGCEFGAKNTRVTNYLGAAERLGVKVRPELEVQSVRQSQRAAVPLRRHRPQRRRREIECKVLVLATGAMGNAPILMRSRAGAAVAVASRSAGTSASTATTSRRSSTTRRRSATCSACPATPTSTWASRSRR